MTDLRYAFRQLLKHPFTNGVIVLTIALLIGAMSVIYASMRNEEARYTPFPEPERLVKFWRTAENRVEELFPAGLFREYAGRLSTFEGLGALEWRPQMTLTEIGEPVSYQAMGVSSGLLPLTGVLPLLGRHFDEADTEAGTDQVVIVSEQLWRDKLGGDTNIIGRELRLNDRPRTVIGVLPESLRDTRLAFNADLWLPARLPWDRPGVNLWLFGRLKPGVTRAQAQAEIDAIGPHLEKDHAPDEFERKVYPGGFKGARVLAISKRISNRGQGIPPQMIIAWVFGGTIIASVIGIAVFNVANLLLARVGARSRELAIRLALGAQRRRLVRQLLTETVLLSLLGGVVGLAVSFWFYDLLRLRHLDVRLDWQLYLIAFSGTLALGVLVGLLPAIRSARTDLTEALKDGGQSTGGRRRHRMRNVLVSSEVAMAVILCVVAGLMTRAFLRLYATDLGFIPEKLLTVQVDLRSDRYPTQEDRHAFAERALLELREMPGVDTAAVSMSYGLLGWGYRDQVMIPATAGTEEKSVQAALTYGTDALPQLLGMRMSRGRSLSRDPSQATSEAVVTESFVAKNLGHTEPIGQQIAVPQGIAASDRRWYTIVGVVRDRHPSTSYQAPEGEVILACREARVMSGTVFVVSTKTSAKTMGRPIRELLQRFDASQPVDQAIFVADLLEKRSAGPRSGMILLGSIAGAGLFIALMGVYGMVAFSVVERTREVGIRMALGAGRNAILKLLVWQGARLILLGALPGIVIGSAITAGLPSQSLISGLSAFDPVTHGVIILVVGAAGFLASFVPARKAADLNPIQALRHE